MRELLTVGKVWELAQDQRRTPGAEPYDLVVVDAPATGHGVAMLAARKTFADAAMAGPVARQGRIIHEMLADPTRTAIVAVTTPEEMPVNETLALRDGLRAGQRASTSRCVVVNGLRRNRLTRRGGRARCSRTASIPRSPPRWPCTRWRSSSAPSCGGCGAASARRPRRCRTSPAAADVAAIARRLDGALA